MAATQPGELWHAHLPAYVDTHVAALTQLRDGQTNRLFKVNKFRKGSTTNTFFDRFRVSFSYCGTWTKVLVIYNASVPRVCPDFIFEEGEEIDIGELTTLSSWDAEEPRALATVMKQIMDVYKKHQMEKVEQCRHERVQFEYQMLQSMGDTVDLKVAERGGELVFSCYAPIEVSLGEKGKTTCHVSITMACDDVGGANCRVDTPPEHADIFSNFQLVQFSQETPISDYLLTTKTHLETLISFHQEAAQSRKEFVTALLQRFGTALEFDSTTFRRASFFFNYDKVKPITLDFILHVALPPNFPAGAPKVSLESMLYTRQGRPIVKSVVDYPYSPRWPSEEKATRLGAFLAAILPDFKANLIQTAMTAKQTGTEQYSGESKGSPVREGARPATAPAAAVATRR